ncbi:MAG TPA: hypothetical protein VGE45_19930 [Chloroflexia bacterium]|jgi:hypothetical protein
MRYETHTDMKREEVFEAARRFFGQEEGGLGMKLGAHQGNQMHFFGDGLIWVTVWPSPPGKPVRVDVDVSDRDKDAHAFIEKVLRAPVRAASGGAGV